MSSAKVLTPCTVHGAEVPARAGRAAVHQRRGGARNASGRRPGADRHRGPRLLQRLRHHGTAQLQVWQTSSKECLVCRVHNQADPTHDLLSARDPG